MSLLRKYRGNGTSGGNVAVWGSMGEGRAGDSDNTEE